MNFLRLIKFLIEMGFLFAISLVPFARTTVSFVSLAGCTYMSAVLFSYLSADRMVDCIGRGLRTRRGREGNGVRHAQYAQCSIDRKFQCRQYIQSVFAYNTNTRTVRMIHSGDPFHLSFRWPATHSLTQRPQTHETSTQMTSSFHVKCTVSFERTAYPSPPPFPTPSFSLPPFISCLLCTFARTNLHVLARYSSIKL